ncbi:helix-turn-helix domain-containing protein [uncultured Microbulbifer sp.]|nr:helix-turn-helix domain-containing protein [uncultured Microbulbifer sp.]
MLGVSRDTFYRYKEAVSSGGVVSDQVTIQLPISKASSKPARNSYVVVQT